MCDTQSHDKMHGRKFVAKAARRLTLLLWLELEKRFPHSLNNFSTALVFFEMRFPPGASYILVVYIFLVVASSKALEEAQRGFNGGGGGGWYVLQQPPFVVLHGM